MAPRIVLAVDDEPAVREAVERALRLDGFEVRTAVDGRDAIRTLPDVRPDAVLLDVLMPGLDGLELDPIAHEVRRGDRQIELTRTEYLLLELFLHHPRQVLTRSQIFERVWGYDFGPSSNSLEVYVGYLRRKTEAGGEPRLLHTVRGVGYVLRAPRA